MKNDENSLKKLLNVPVLITIAGKEFKASSPTLKDLAEAQQHVKDLKKAKRKEALKERLDLLAELPKDMPQAEKKELLDSFIPQELTPQEKLDLIESLPANLPEVEKQKRLAFAVIEKDGTEWAEALFILFKCLQKNHKEMTFQDVENLVTIKDLKNVLEVINPQDVEEKDQKKE